MSISSSARCSTPARHIAGGSTCSANAAPSTPTSRGPVLRAGQGAGLGARIHANQLGPGPGARLAAEVGAASADHCTHLDDDDVTALADAGVVATLLPLAEFTTRSPYPDARRLLDGRRDRRAGHRLQPGLGLQHLMPMAIALAVRAMRLTPAEAVWAATAGGAARAAARRRGGAASGGEGRPRPPRRSDPRPPRLPPRRSPRRHRDPRRRRRGEGALNRTRRWVDTPGMSVRGARLRVLTACVAAAVLVCSASVTHASTADRIDRARAQLREL